MKPSKEPMAVPSPDGGTVELTKGMRVVRRPIYQNVQSREGWQNEMVERIAAAKALGFTLFEVDVTAVQTPAPPDGMVYISIFGTTPAVEGDEWKGDDNKRKLMKNRVVTVYALVVE